MAISCKGQLPPPPSPHARRSAGSAPLALSSTSNTASPRRTCSARGARLPTSARPWPRRRRVAPLGSTRRSWPRFWPSCRWTWPHRGSGAGVRRSGATQIVYYFYSFLGSFVQRTAYCVQGPLPYWRIPVLTSLSFHVVCLCRVGVARGALVAPHGNRDRDIARF